MCDSNDLLTANNKVLAEQFEASEDNAAKLRQCLDDSAAGNGVTRHLNGINEAQMEKIHRLQSENESVARANTQLKQEWQDK